MRENEFRALHQPGRKSKLEPYAESLISLARDGYTLRQLQEFVASEGVSVSTETLARFLRKRRAESPGLVSADQGLAGARHEGSVLPGRNYGPAIREDVDLNDQTAWGSSSEPAAAAPLSAAGAGKPNEASTGNSVAPPRIAKYSTVPIVKPIIDLRDESTWPKPKAGAASGIDGVQRPVGTAGEGVVPAESTPVPGASVPSPPWITKYTTGQIIKRGIDLRTPDAPGASAPAPAASGGNFDESPRTAPLQPATYRKIIREDVDLNDESTW